jgi:hypothetical protein
MSIHAGQINSATTKSKRIVLRFDMHFPLYRILIYRKEKIVVCRMKGR